MNLTIHTARPAPRYATTPNLPAARRLSQAEPRPGEDLQPPPSAGAGAGAQGAAGPRLVPILDAADDDPWRFGWLDSSIELRRGLCVCEDDAPWGGR